MGERESLPRMPTIRLLDQTLPQHVRHSLSPVLTAEFPEDVPDVRFDGPLSDGERGGDLLVFAPFRQFDQDFELSRGETLGLHLSRTLLAREPTEMVHELAGDLRMKKGPAVAD